MVGWHHRLNGHEFEQPPGVSDGQGKLVCCSPWCHKESDMAEQLTLESPLDCKQIQPVHSKGDQSWVFIERTDVEAETNTLVT